ncbi:MAG: 1-acyl-sn-glycerol-3-phosphate acyltransferase [Pyrinomonadaceae bacterium]
MMQQVSEIKDFTRATKPVAELGQPTGPELRSVRIQTAICWLMLLPFGGFLTLLLLAKGYRIKNKREIRRRFAQMMRDSDRPLLLCSNHLTFIDSALIIVALGSNWWYLFHYQAFPWNLPAGDFFKKKLKYHVTLFLMKCIFIHRDGSSEHKNAVLGLCRYLLNDRQNVLVFPEGQRSRSGRFAADALTLGASRLVSTVPDCRVLCLYLRSAKQETYSNYPPAGAHFSLGMKMIEPATEKSGKDGLLDLTEQIGATIAGLEAEFFATQKKNVGN